MNERMRGDSIPSIVLNSTPYVEFYVNQSNPEIFISLSWYFERLNFVSFYWMNENEYLNLD